jgi:fatty acid desaturase
MPDPAAQPPHPGPADASAGSPFGAAFRAPRGPWTATFTRATNAYSTWRASPSWVQRTLGTIALLVFLGLAAILLVIALAVGAVIAALVGVVLILRKAWFRLTGLARPTGGSRSTRPEPASDLDPLRQNVRVIPRHSAETPP